MMVPKVLCLSFMFLECILKSRTKMQVFVDFKKIVYKRVRSQWESLVFFVNKLFESLHPVAENSRSSKLSMRKQILQLKYYL